LTTYFSAKELLSPPTERAAFSDRQAYVCAELSKLAYFKFEGGHTLDQALAIAKDILGNDERLILLEQQLRVVLSSAPSTAAEGQAALGRILKEVEFDLVKTFTVEGTQAFFCTRKVVLESGTPKTLAFLVFRGTEPKDFRDIKSDVRAALKEYKIDDEVIEFHSGYLDAFELVRTDIAGALKGTSFDQLFITGHSLGGALAIVATRILASEITGACYTFGAPPIGTVAVQNKLKTPVYEIINEIDIVPRLPNPWMTSGFLVLLRALRLVAKSVTVIEKILASGSWDEKLEAFIESMTKYRHPGYVSYLVGAGASARLRYNVSSFDRFRWWYTMMWKRRIWQFNKMLTDHSIDEYIAKLRVHALSRQ
jgi:hypothetical protein